MSRLQRWLKKYLPDAAPPIKAAVADGYELAMKHARTVKPSAWRNKAHQIVFAIERKGYEAGYADGVRAMREALKELEK